MKCKQAGETEKDLAVLLSDLTRACSRRPPASAALPLTAAPDAQREAAPKRIRVDTKGAFMPKPAVRFDAESVRASWDHAADAYAQGQASGSDYYRYEFFGPAQVALCGEVRGMSILDVGCGNGSFARAVARRGARVTGIDLSAGRSEHG